MNRGGEIDFEGFKVNSNVLELIAGLSATEVEGVASLAGGVISSITDWLGKKGSKGVEIATENGQIVIDIHLSFGYGYSIREVARKVQANVKDALENMTGLTVKAVNVFIEKVEFSESSSF